jgi:hypothetical protein
MLLIGGVLALVVVVALIVSLLRGRVAALMPVRAQAERTAAAPTSSGRSSPALAWPIAFVLGCLFVAWGIAVRPSAPEGVARQSLDVRSADLTIRVLAANSPLACLDAVSNATVEASCEKTLFSSPETLAAAIAYVDARLSLFVEGAELARNAATGTAFERMRRAIEQDRYGLVAHVLATRGCSADNCPTLQLMRDPSLVQANLKDRTFDANVVLHASAWRGDVPVAGLPPAGVSSLVTGVVPLSATSNAPSPPTPSSPSKFEFPSSASIPAISIMNAEPAQPPAAAKAEQPPASAKPAASLRRQSARENTSQASPPGPPVQIAPEAPAPVGTLANPGTPPR